MGFWKRLLPRAWATRGASRPVAGPVEPAASPTPLAPAAAAEEGRFAACLRHVLRYEGGFVNDPQDPGGATNLGITRATLARWRGRPVTVDEVRALRADEAAAIYRMHYWRPLRCDELPAGVDLTAFDFGVNAGPGTAARMLQRTLGVPEDGRIGPVTLAAARRADTAWLIDEMARRRQAHYRALESFPRFGRGWLRRTEEVRLAAQRMMAGRG